MKKYRNEWKYILPEATLSAMENRLRSILDTDEYADEEGYYRIRSLYFDDIFDSAARENEAGVSERFKYRIRYYNDDTDFIRLERKEKKNNLCHKDSCRITKTEYEAIVEGKFEELIYEEEKPLLRRFALDGMKRGYSPKLIVDYERVAFTEEITNVRITIDRKISVSSDIEEFLTGEYGLYPLQENGRNILEVKFDDILPSYIRAATDEEKLIQTAFSKYYLGRLQIQRMEI